MKEAVLRFFGPRISEQGEIPLDVLVNTLSGFQQTAFILEAEMEGIAIKRRFKPNESIKKAASLVCGIPLKGSYCVPVYLNQIGEFAPDTETVLDKAFNVLESVASKTEEDFRSLVPDSRFRDKILQAVSTFLPKAGDRWELEYSQTGKAAITLNNATKSRIKDWDISTSSVEQEDTVMTVTGELIKIDFSGNCVSIRHPVSQREIECVYLPDIEDTLIDSRRDLIQVTGQFTLDEQGLPTKLTDVTKIEPVDLDHFTISEVSVNGNVFSVEPALEIQPKLDDTKQYMVAEVEDLDLNVCGITREVLVDEIQEHLEMLWIEYASEDDANLTESAKKLKHAVKSRLHKSSDDPS